MIQTLGIAKDSASTGDVHTRYGVVDENAATGYDQLTLTLVRFLDARVEQANAESFMTSQAKKDFANASNCLFLYTSRTNHLQWTGYEVSSRSDKNGEATFIAIMTTDSGTSGYV